MNNRELRMILQAEGIAAIQKKRGDKEPILKSDSLIRRARKLGIATDMPSINRQFRRRDLREAVRTEKKHQKREVI